MLQVNRKKNKLALLASLKCLLISKPIENQEFCNNNKSINNVYLKCSSITRLYLTETNLQKQIYGQNVFNSNKTIVKVNLAGANLQ